MFLKLWAMSYKRLGSYITLIDNRNRDLSAYPLLGVSVQKRFIPSIANIIGSDMSKYKIIEKNNFTYIADTSRRGDKIGIALLKEFEKAIVSQAYTSFKIIDENELSPDYLMMWFSRPEFDRYARYHSIGSVREVFDWKDMCDVELPIPSIEEQNEIVAQYQSIENKIKVNEQICEKLEATAQALYKNWFVDFEFPDENGKPYKSSGGKMIWDENLENKVPHDWQVIKLEEIANLKYGKMLDSENFIEQGYPVFSGYGIRGYYTKYMYEKPQIIVLCRGVSGTGEVKMSPPFSFITNLSIIVENKEEVISKQFLFYFLKNDNLRSLDSGSAQSMITTGDLYNRNILLPNRRVQIDFEKIIERIFNYCESSKQQIQKLTQLQNLLLAQLAVWEEMTM
ncbi:MAG TPA: hypothetical protein DIT10_22540 [Chryseobacterium sp.]|nr:hypothetical protein [Chryseobacterium sp.]